MLAVVIPARNEAPRIQTVVRLALRLPTSLIIPVLNGCDDMTAEIVRRTVDRRINPIHFREPLGFDVPRIAGAQAALEAGALAVLFVDADLTGRIEDGLLDLIDGVRRRGLDLALSDCYAATPIPFRQSAAREVYQARHTLNRSLGRKDLDVAIPSHGPVVVSRHLLRTVPLEAVGVPPLMQAYACRAGLRVDIGAAIPHQVLGSAQRESEHRLKIAETIIGDCYQATCLAEGRPLDRRGRLGYHPERRFDLVGLLPPAEGVAMTAGESRED